MILAQEGVKARTTHKSHDCDFHIFKILERLGWSRKVPVVVSLEESKVVERRTLLGSSSL